MLYSLTISEKIRLNAVSYQFSVTITLSSVYFRKILENALSGLSLSITFMVSDIPEANEG